MSYRNSQIQKKGIAQSFTSSGGLRNAVVFMFREQASKMRTINLQDIHIACATANLLHSALHYLKKR